MAQDEGLEERVVELERLLAEKDATIEALGKMLTTPHDVLNRSSGAVMESSLKVYATMKRLFAANDVKFDSIMRMQIAEHMNDLGRNVIDFFHNTGLVTYTSREAWPPKFKRD